MASLLTGLAPSMKMQGRISIDEAHVGQRLNALDLAFLALETHKTPVNVAGLVVLKEPADYQGNYVRDLLDELLKQEPGPPFDRRLSDNRFGRPEWVTDQHFDIEYHVRHSALPKPGRMRDLLALASRLHSRVMDRKRPLWEFHIIEGLSGGRFAIYTKMHHAAIDGIGGIEILESCFTTDPDAPLRAPWLGTSKARRRRQSTGLLAKVAGTAKQVINQAQLSTGLGRLLLGHGLKAIGLRPNHSPVPFTAPKSLFNVPISGARRFEVASLPLAEVKQLKRASGATVNDIVLAVCSGALRAYLREKRDLPNKSLIATVPVSVRQMNRSGNQITYVAAKLATNRKTPLGRLRAIAESTAQAKHEVASVSPAAASTFAVISQGLVAVMNRFHMTEWLPPPANVVISNVPGPRRPLYFGGAQMEANYPLSVLVDGQALNITVISYCDSIDFGLMADRDVVPDADHLADLIGEAYDELKQAVVAKATAEESKSIAASSKSPSVKKKLKKTQTKKTQTKKARAKKARKKKKDANKTVEKSAKKTQSQAGKNAARKEEAGKTSEAGKETNKKEPGQKKVSKKKVAKKKTSSKKNPGKKIASKSSVKKAAKTKSSETLSSGPANGTTAAAAAKPKRPTGQRSRKPAADPTKPKKTLRQAREKSS